MSSSVAHPWCDSRVPGQASPLTLTETNHCCANKKSMHCPCPARSDVLLCPRTCVVQLRFDATPTSNWNWTHSICCAASSTRLVSQGVLPAFFARLAAQIKFSAVSDMRRLLRLAKCLARPKAKSPLVSGTAAGVALLLTFRFGSGFGNSSISVTLIAQLFFCQFFTSFCSICFFFAWISRN